MKKLDLVALIALGLPMMGHAQSNTTLYGIVDAGVTFISNQQGKHNLVLATGMQTPNLFGIRGNEELGGGLKAVYVLEGQFALENGATIGSGVFGRQSYVGLSGPWGALTLGNQYEFMFESLSARRLGPNLAYVSLYNLQQGPFQALGTPFGGLDFNRVAGAFRVANSLKYASNDINGFSFGAMYGLGEVAGAFGQNSTTSLGGNYDHGPLALNAAYTYVKSQDMDSGNKGIRNWGFGGRYLFGTLTLDAIYTNTRNTLTSGRVNVYDVGVTSPIAAGTTIRADYQIMKGNSQLGNNKANQFGLTLDYAFSKRTDVYANLVYQKASGDANPAAFISGLPASSADGNQTATRVGLRHFF